MPAHEHHLDAVILGGGIAGLWTLDTLRRRGVHAVLLERAALGQGQTLWSQGIIHGGLKYTLSGLLNPAAQAVRDMPDRWRACLAGKAEPDLSRAKLRAPHCHLWRTESLSSKVAMIGAKVGLRVTPTTLHSGERPEALRHVPGTVARLEEQVIDVASVLSALAARHAGRVWLAPRASVDRDDTRVRVTVDAAAPDAPVLLPRTLVLTAGAGNAMLRDRLGLQPNQTQVRPLHQVMMRGELPELNGHCVDGSVTRVTITTAKDSAGRTVWQVGGQLAEEGVHRTPEDLIAHAKRELAACLPGVDLSRAEWATYRADRAEMKAPGALRPDDATLLVEGPVISAWPTKLALAPRLADLVTERAMSAIGSAAVDQRLPEWEAAGVGAEPWEDQHAW
ncbi:MAG: FAD-dependent oxidoreductase [Planctomycetes bacterium]|nr:FAD-dependent oxidoreductase [Planctomycetota bacterium]